MVKRGNPDDEKLQGLITDIRAREYPYEEKEREPIDWSRYTKAQIEEVNDTLTLIRESVEGAPSPPDSIRGRGRPAEYQAKDLAKVLLMQQYFSISNRVAEGHARLFKEKLRLDRVPNYKAIERAYEDPDVSFVLDGVFALTQEPEKGQIEGFAADGSGITKSMKANWESDKKARNSKDSKESKRERFDGSVIMLTLPNQIITSYVPLVVGFQNESPTLGRLVEKTLVHHPSLEGVVTLDAAYCSRDNHTLVKEAGGVPRIFPKRHITLKRSGSFAWVQSYRQLLGDPQTWLREYHQRSLSETAWSTHKRRHPKPLRKRIDRRLATERHSRFTVDNLTRLGYLRRLQRVVVSWVPRGALN